MTDNIIEHLLAAVDEIETLAESLGENFRTCMSPNANVSYYDIVSGACETIRGVINEYENFVDDDNNPIALTEKGVHWWPPSRTTKTSS